MNEEWSIRPGDIIRMNIRICREHGQTEIVLKQNIGWKILREILEIVNYEGPYEFVDEGP